MSSRLDRAIENHANIQQIQHILDSGVLPTEDTLWMLIEDGVNRGNYDADILKTILRYYEGSIEPEIFHNMIEMVVSQADEQGALAGFEIMLKREPGLARSRDYSGDTTLFTMVSYIEHKLDHRPDLLESYGIVRQFDRVIWLLKFNGADTRDAINKVLTFDPSPGRGHLLRGLREFIPSTPPTPERSPEVHRRRSPSPSLSHRRSPTSSVKSSSSSVRRAASKELQSRRMSRK